MRTPLCTGTANGRRIDTWQSWWHGKSAFLSISWIFPRNTGQRWWSICSMNITPDALLTLTCFATGKSSSMLSGRLLAKWVLTWLRRDTIAARLHCWMLLAGLSSLTASHNPGCSKELIRTRIRAISSASSARNSFRLRFSL